MSKRKPMCMVAASALAVALASCCIAGCGQQPNAANDSAAGGTQAPAASMQETVADSSSPYITADVDGDTVSFDASGVGTDATFVNYKASDGITVQMIAVRDDAGKLHVALNTCQSCSPSPAAYFVQEDDKLVCQNCLNAFTAEDVGVAASGCNPTPLESLKVKGDTVRVSAAELDSYSAAFSQWDGPVE